MDVGCGRAMDPGMLLSSGLSLVDAVATSGREGHSDRHGPSCGTSLCPQYGVSVPEPGCPYDFWW